MRFNRLHASILLLTIAAAPVLTGCGPSMEARLARTSGVSAEDAFKVANVAQEYEILRALGLEVTSQALSTIGGRPYDILTATDPATGEERQIWFDISSFYGRF